MSIIAAQPQTNTRQEPALGVTPAEINVLKACQRWSTANPEVLSPRLCCATSTTRHHLARLREKLKVRDTVGVIVTAYERGMLQPGACAEKTE